MERLGQEVRLDTYHMGGVVQHVGKGWGEAVQGVGGASRCLGLPKALQTLLELLTRLPQPGRVLRDRFCAQVLKRPTVQLQDAVG